jgi:hypothetical protein
LYFFIATSGTHNLYLRDSIQAGSLNGGNNLIFSGIVVNQLYHFVYVNKGTSWDIYKDGVLLTTLTGKTPANSLAKTLNFIGRSNVVGANPLEGTIDGFFIYQGQLSASQILEIYEKGQKPVQTNFYYTIPIQPYTYTYANNFLSYYFDFNDRPPHPYGGNRYRVYSSFISIGTPFIVARTNQTGYYLIDGLGNVNNLIGRGGNPANQMKTNNLIKNLTLKRSTNFVGNNYNQKWIDLDPMLAMIIENLNDTGVLTVEIRTLQGNALIGNVATWGAQANNYLIQLLFEPIPN